MLKSYLAVGLLTLAMAGCDIGSDEGEDRTGDHVVRTFTSAQHGTCALTDQRFEGPYEGNVALCVIETDDAFVTCTVFAGRSGRNGREVEWHGEPARGAGIEIRSWETPGCAPAARKARRWLESRVRARPPGVPLDVLYPVSPWSTTYVLKPWIRSASPR